MLEVIFIEKEPPAFNLRNLYLKIPYIDFFGDDNIFTIVDLALMDRSLKILLKKFILDLDHKMILSLKEADRSNQPPDSSVLIKIVQELINDIRAIEYPLTLSTTNPTMIDVLYQFTSQALKTLTKYSEWEMEVHLTDIIYKKEELNSYLTFNKRPLLYCIIDFKNLLEDIIKMVAYKEKFWY